MPWTFRALDQNNLGLDNALRTLRSFIEASSPNDADVQQALKRLELQLAPVTAGLALGDPRDAARCPVASRAGAQPSAPAAGAPPSPRMPSWRTRRKPTARRCGTR